MGHGARDIVRNLSPYDTSWSRGAMHRWAISSNATRFTRAECSCPSWWRHQMETFSALLAICVWGIHRSPVNSPHKGQWRGALMFSLICVWINGWVNNREAGDLRCYRAQYDVIVKFLRANHKHLTKVLYLLIYLNVFNVKEGSILV